VVAFQIAGGYDHLFEERQRPVDVGGFLEREALGPRLLDALVTGQVDEMQLRVDHFL